MYKTMLVGLREFRQRVRNRGFLITSVLTPVFLIAMWALTGRVSPTSGSPLVELPSTESQDTVIGYVDQADLIQVIPAPLSAEQFREFPDVDAAEAALENGDIDAYYVVPPDYRETGNLLRTSPRLSTAPPDAQWFRWILVRNLLPDVPAEQVARLNLPFGGGGPAFVAINTEGEREGGGSFLPLVITITIMVPLFTSGSFLFQSLAQEKSNRVMEILLVSLRPQQLLTGKLLGLGALTLVQYATWVILSGAGLLLLGREPGQLFAGLNLTPNELALILAFALGGFLLYASLMAGLGALARDLQSSRAWVFALTLPMLIPIYLWTAIASAPNGLLATIFSLIPFSAPVAMLMRMTSTAVPIWQIAVSLALLVLTGVAMLWLMARLFRAQTLLSGEKFSLARLWSALSAAQ